MTEAQFELLREKYNDLAAWNPDTFPYSNQMFKMLQKSLFSGIEEMVNDLFIFERMQSLYVGHDIYQKLKILKRRSIQFGRLAGFLFELRNIIIHRGLLKVNLIQNITINLISLFDANLIFWYNLSFNKFFDEWLHIYNTILIDAPPKIKFIFTFEDIMEDTPISEEVMPFPLRIDEPMSLKYYRNNGYKEVLKGRNIKILDGKWADHTMILIAWNGTCVYFLFNGTRIGMPIDRLVKIL